MVKIEEYPKVGIVISCWNRLEMLKQVIESVYKQDYPNFEIIVVDNCSKDGSDNYIKTLHEKYNNFYCKIMDNSKYSAMETLNVGFKIAIEEHSVDYILVMDDDCILQEVNTITKLVKDIQSKPNIGMVACNVVGPIKPLPLLEFKFPMTKYIDIKRLPKRPFRVYDFIGCCALFNANIFKSIGLYDEYFNIYWNEADTALKLLYNNFDVLYDSTVSPIHYISQTNRFHKRGWFYYVRNGNIILNRFLSLRNRLVLVPIRSLIMIAYGIKIYKDPILVMKVIATCFKSCINIFYMKSRVTPCNDEIYREVNEAYSAFTFRKFYEWLLAYPVIKL